MNSGSYTVQITTGLLPMPHIYTKCGDNTDVHAQLELTWQRLNQLFHLADAVHGEHGLRRCNVLQIGVGIE